MLPLLLSEARLLIEMLPGLSANISTGFLIFFRVDLYCPLKAMMTTAFSISASSTSCWMTRLSESSQNKTAHRDWLMVGSFLVGEELARLVVLVKIIKILMIMPWQKNFSLF